MLSFVNRPETSAMSSDTSARSVLSPLSLALPEASSMHSKEAPTKKHAACDECRMPTFDRDESLSNTQIQEQQRSSALVIKLAVRDAASTPSSATSPTGRPWAGQGRGRGKTTAKGMGWKKMQRGAMIRAASTVRLCQGWTTQISTSNLSTLFPQVPQSQALWMPLLGVTPIS